MGTQFSDLKLRQLDATLDCGRKSGLPPRPPSGWIKAIREALGMPATHLAGRLGVAPSTVARLETSEADDTISLATLRRAAEVLDCELHYALVPRKSLAEMLQVRATGIARRQMAAIAHSMGLEAQSTSQETLDAQARTSAENLLKGSRRALWKDAAPGDQAR